MSAKVEISRTDRTAGDLKAMAKKSKCKDHRRRLRAIARVLAGEESRSRGREARRGRPSNLARPGAPLQRGRSGRIEKPLAFGAADATGRRPGGGGPGMAGDRPRSGRRRAGPPGRRRHPAEDRESFRNQIQRRGGAPLDAQAWAFGTCLPARSTRRPIPAPREEFRSNFKELARKVLPGGVSPESAGVRFQDEARIGRKGMLSRVWARKGTRPRIPRDHRRGYCYLFSAACPSTGQAVGHVCERANTDEMNRHLKDVGAAVPEGEHAIIVLDGAGLAPLQGSGGSRQRFPASAAALQPGTRSHGNGFLAAQAQAFREPRVPDRRACPRCRRGGMEQLRGASERSQKNHRSGLGRAMKKPGHFHK